jgi:hypothetical protein
VSVAGQRWAVIAIRKGARAARHRIRRTIPFRMVRMKWAVSRTTAGCNRWMRHLVFRFLSLGLPFQQRLRAHLGKSLWKVLQPRRARRLGVKMSFGQEGAREHIREFSIPMPIPIPTRAGSGCRLGSSSALRLCGLSFSMSLDVEE